jgi:hypothetical protein
VMHLLSHCASSRYSRLSNFCGPRPWQSSCCVLAPGDDNITVGSFKMAVFDLLRAFYPLIFKGGPIKVEESHVAASWLRYVRLLLLCCVCSAPTSGLAGPLLTIVPDLQSLACSDEHCSLTQW